MRSALPIAIFGLIGTGILLWLGIWQMQRLEWKQGVLAAIEARIDDPSEPLPADPDPEAQRYQPVALSGTIEDGELHVLVSVKRVGPGYRVIAPFETAQDRRVLLDRGFIPTDAKAAQRSTGPHDVRGNLHWPDDRTSSTPANDVAGNIWFARDIAQMADTLGTEPFLVIARDVSPADPAVTPLPVDTSGIPNDHLQYAITWFSLAAVWIVMTGVVIWRTRKT